MSTRGVIARLTGAVPVGFEGRYHHWDSYPSGLGTALWHLYHGHFGLDLSAMLRVLLDEHPAGWSTIVGADFTLSPGFCGPKRSTEDCPPECYCHGERDETAWHVTDRNASGSGCEWAYAFVPGSDSQHDILVILSSYRSSGQKMIGMFGQGDPGAKWAPVAVVGLGGEEPDWDKLDRAVPLEPSVTFSPARAVENVEPDNRQGIFRVCLADDVLHYVGVRAASLGELTFYCTCSHDETAPSPNCPHAQAVREHLLHTGTLARERRERGLVYSGTRLFGSGSPCAWVWDGYQPALLSPDASLRLWNHSSAGFEWGYEGSGPAQLALAILLDFSGDEWLAVSYHQQFKREIIALLPRSEAGWQLEGRTIQEFLSRVAAEHGQQ